MTFWVWLGFGLATANVLLAAIVLLACPRRASNLSGSLFLLTIAIWNATNGFFELSVSTSRGSALHLALVRLAYSSGALVVVACVLFVLYFTRGAVSRLELGGLTLGGVGLFALTQGTRLVVQRLQGPPAWDWVPGPLYPLYAALMVGLAGWLVLAVGRGYRRSRGLRRLQLQYLFLGFSLFAFLATTGSILLPAVGMFALNSIDTPSSVFLSGALAYVLLAYRLLDIRRLLGRLTLLSLAAAALLLLNSAAVRLLAQHVSEKMLPQVALLLSIASFLAVWLPLRRTAAYRAFISFFRLGKSDIFRESVETMLGMLDRDVLLHFISETLQRFLHLTRVQIYWADHLRTSEPRYLRLVQDTASSEEPFAGPPPAALVKHAGGVLVYEELEQRPQDPESEEICRFLTANGGKICVPWVVRGELEGCFVLGDKPHGDAFTREDLAATRSFLLQAGIALQNAFLYEDAVSDGLTRLFNRRYLQARLSEQYELASRYERAFAVLMLDVDYFKAVNDHYGHQTGDRVLVAVADCVRSCVRVSDTTARYGGEEFLVLLPEYALDANGLLLDRGWGALQVAERVRARVENLAIPAGKETIHVTVSIGGCIFEPHAGFSAGQDVVAHADEALYAAKREGRNRVRLWHRGQIIAGTAASTMPIVAGAASTMPMA